MNKPPAFQFYPKDFLSDENVFLMNNAEVGCYIKLLCFCWDQESIPDDINKLAKLCNEPNEKMAQLWTAIRPCFENGSTKGRLINQRLNKERKKQMEFRKERAASGKKGAKTRWKDKDSSAMAQPIAQPIAKHGSAVFSLQSSSSSSLSSIKPKEEKNKNKPFVPNDKNHHPKPTKINFNFETSNWENIKPKDMIIWTEAYPACHVINELTKMAAWLIANPNKKKSQYKRFINSWLSRQQDRGGTRGIPDEETWAERSEKKERER